MFGYAHVEFEAMSGVGVDWTLQTALHSTQVLPEEWQFDRLVADFHEHLQIHFL